MAIGKLGARGGFGRSGAVLGRAGTGGSGLPSALLSVTRAGNAWTFTFQRTGSTAASRNDGYAVSGSSLNGNPSVAGDFSGAVFPTGTMTFSIGNATTTVTITPTSNDAEPN